MSEKLKPCPFCPDGGDVQLVTFTGSADDVDDVVHCHACHTILKHKIWQTRPIEDALRKRIAELEAAQRWRVVADGELPDNWESVLTIDISKSTRGPVTAFYNPEISLWSTHFSCDLWVTHWMPLPESPIMYGKVCEE